MLASVTMVTHVLACCWSWWIAGQPCRVGPACQCCSFWWFWCAETTASQLHCTWLWMLVGGNNGSLLHCTVLGGRHGLVILLWTEVFFRRPGDSNVHDTSMFACSQPQGQLLWQLHICLHLPVHRAGRGQQNYRADICLCKLCFLQTHVEVVHSFFISQTAAVDQHVMTPTPNAPDRSTHCCLQSLFATTCRWGPVSAATGCTLFAIIVNSEPS